MIARAILVAAFLFGAACSRDDAEQTVKNPKLIELGSVHEEIVRPGLIRVIGGFERDSFEFKGNDVLKTVDVYASQDGGQPALTIFYKGTYDRGTDLGSEVYEINFHFQTVEMIARTEDAMKLLNGLTFCGKNDFKVGEAANLTANSADPLCPLDDVPFNVFDVYKVEGDRVFFGKGDKTKAETRPHELDREHPFIKR